MHTGRRIQLPVERLRQMSGERKRELCRVQLGAGGPFERRGKKLGKKFEVCKTLNSTLNLLNNAGSAGLQWLAGSTGPGT